MVLICSVVPIGPANAQQGTFVGLGRMRRSSPVAGGVFLGAQHGGVLVQSIAGIGVRVRVRFGDAVTAAFPATRSIATGDSAPRVGTAVIRETADGVTIRAEGMTVTASRAPLRVSVRDSDGRLLLSESLGASTWQGRVAHVVHSDSGTRFFGLGEQPTGLDRSGSTFPF